MLCDYVVLWLKRKKNPQSNNLIDPSVSSDPKCKKKKKVYCFVCYESFFIIIIIILQHVFVAKAGHTPAGFSWLGAKDPITICSLRDQISCESSLDKQAL